MSRYWITRNFAISLAVATMAAISIGASIDLTRPQPRRDHNPVGDTIPSVLLQDMDGHLTTLREKLGGQPGIIYVYGVAECLGCSDLQMEFRAIRETTPGLKPILIATGAGLKEFEKPLRDARLQSAALIDEKNAFLKALGVHFQPLVLIVTAEGRVLYADSRNATQSARFPMGEVLNDLKGLIAPTESHRVPPSLGGL